MQIAIIIVINFVSSLLFLIFIEIPYIWIGLVWGGTFFYISASREKVSIKLFWLYFGIIFCTISIGETYVWWKEKSIKKPPPRYETYPQNMINLEDEILGYSPIKNSRVNHILKHGNDLDFDVVYTIDENGLRKSPTCIDNSQNSILFFGGSFTFGIGMNDEDTMPYRVGLKTKGEYLIYNFGFNGYGPHQMLSAIENDLVKSVVTIPPKYIIYQVIRHHIDRILGMSVWDKKGPKYILTTDGNIEFAGHFNDDIGVNIENSLLGVTIKAQFMSSVIFTKLLYKWNYYQLYSEHNIELLAKIVTRSNELLKKQFKDCDFHIIYWDGDNTSYDKILQGFKSEGLKVHLMSNILPDYFEKKVSAYQVSKNDRHPSALAHDIIADYIRKNIILNNKLNLKLIKKEK